MHFTSSSQSMKFPSVVIVMIMIKFLKLQSSGAHKILIFLYNYDFLIFTEKECNQE